MNKKETVKRIMKDNGGIAKTADFVAEVLSPLPKRVLNRGQRVS